MSTTDKDQPQRENSESKAPAQPAPDTAKRAPEIGGRPGPDPTRYGDWEKNGRCIDF